MKDYMNILADNILDLRKKSGLTQEALANKLGITYQAISKWENCQSSPDILLLPELANIFGVSVDTLFSINRNSIVDSLPWDNDDIIRGVLFLGKHMISNCDDLSKFTFVIEGDAKNVQSHCNIRCDSILGNANAGCDISCENVNGGAVAGCDINCSNVSGGANAGCDINCNSDISGGANAGCDINCSNISGDVSAGCDINCLNINGNIS